VVQRLKWGFKALERGTKLQTVVQNLKWGLTALERGKKLQMWAKSFKWGGGLKTSER